MLVVESQDAQADNAAFVGGRDRRFRALLLRAARPARRWQRGARRLHARLRRDRAACPDAGFFACQQHEPQNFWSPALQAHPNGAQALKGVVMLAEAPAALLPFLAGLTGAPPICTGDAQHRDRDAARQPRGDDAGVLSRHLGDEACLAARSRRRACRLQDRGAARALAERLAAAGIAHRSPSPPSRRRGGDNLGATLIVEEPRAV